MEDIAQISKDISHSFDAETFVLSFPLTASCGERSAKSERVSRRELIL